MKSAEILDLDIIFPNLTDGERKSQNNVNGPTFLPILSRNGVDIADQNIYTTNYEAVLYTRSNLRFTSDCYSSDIQILTALPHRGFPCTVFILD